MQISPLRVYQAIKNKTQRKLKKNRISPGISQSLKYEMKAAAS